VSKHRPALDRIAHALLEHETLNREEIEALFANLPVESRSTLEVGVVTEPEPNVIRLTGD